MKIRLCLLLGVGFVLASQFFSAAQTQRGHTVRINAGDGKEVELYAESHALIIGASDYTNGWPSLPGVKKDVPAVAAALRAHGFNMTIVNNPTRSQLETALRDFIQQYGEQSGNRLLLYFAGHGYTRDSAAGQQGYIVPVDAPKPTDKNTAAFKRAVLNMDEIDSLVRQIEAKHVLWLFDSCFSGALFEATRSAPPTITERTQLLVRQFITAGTAEQPVPDRSIFREQFVAALQGAGDLNQDGYVTGEELGYFLSTSVANYSKNAQTPRYGKIRNPKLDKGDFVFELSEKPARPRVRPTATPLPKPTIAPTPTPTPTAPTVAGLRARSSGAHNFGKYLSVELKECLYQAAEARCVVQYNNLHAEKPIRIDLYRDTRLTYGSNGSAPQTNGKLTQIINPGRSVEAELLFNLPEGLSGSALNPVYFYLNVKIGIYVERGSWQLNFK